MDEKTIQAPEEVEVPKTKDFTERLESAIVVAHTPDQMFIIEFLKPEISLYADKRTGKFTKQEGKLASDVRIYLPPKTAKSLLNALKEQIEKYEKEYGKIEDTSKSLTRNEG